MQGTSQARWRDIAVLAAITAAFAATLWMLGEAIGFASPWFGVMVMFDALGIIAFARPVFLLALPESLRKVRAFESRGRVYKALRVPRFGVLLRRTALRHLNPTVYLSQGDSAAVLAQVEAAEAAHFVAAAVLVPYMVLAGVQGSWRALAGLVAIQVAFNLYPIGHLRWVRIRLSRQREKRASSRAGDGAIAQ